MFPSTSLSYSSSHLIVGPHFSINGHHSSPSSISFRPSTISAASCTSTAERTRPHRTTSSSSSPSLYEVLGVRIGATSREIKTAYRRLARVLHPDAVVSDSQWGRESQSSGIEFMRVHEAYETLSDPEKRAGYDRTLLILRQRSVDGTFEMSRCTAVPIFEMGYRRTWETDQCW